MKDFEELYNAYYKKLYAFCLTLTRRATEAEELAEEAFCRALTGFHKFRGESDVGTWLCSIARNLFITEQKKKKRRPRYEPPPDDFSDLEDREEAQRILVAANALEEPYRGVFLYRVIGGMGNEEIGALYGKNANWAYVTYYRAKLKIIEKLEKP